jgi:glycosyltransferase involved in cell wall biosynthesis
LPAPSPTFSVIIPNFNNGSTLARAIRSVLDQEYPAHEIIIVDDGSTDDSEVVAQEFAGRVTYIYQDNGGVAVARNRGVQHASGEWVAFLDADDEFTSERLSVHAKWIQEEPDIDFFLGDQEARGATVKPIASFIAGCEAGRKLLSSHPGVDRIRLYENNFEDLICGGFMEIRTISVPRVTFLDLGGFPVGHKVGEDLHFFVRLIANSSKVGVVPKILAIYHIYPTSALRRNPVQAAEDFLSSIESLNHELGNFSNAVRNGYRKKRHLIRVMLAHAYLRNNRKPQAISVMFKSFLQLPRLNTFKDFLSVVRGFPKSQLARTKNT